MKKIANRISTGFFQTPALFKKSSAGFTLIELLVVIAIIGLLATVITVNYQKSQMKARDSKRKEDISTYRSAVESYFDDYNVYPAADNSNAAAQILSACPTSTTICDDAVSHNSNRIQYLQDVLEDPIVNRFGATGRDTRSFWKIRIIDDSIQTTTERGWVFYRYAYSGGGQTADLNYNDPNNSSTNAFSYIISAGMENSTESSTIRDSGRNRFRYEVGNAKTTRLCESFGTANSPNGSGGLGSAVDAPDSPTGIGGDCSN